MKRHIPGLHGDSPNTPSILEGVFLVRVDRVFYRWALQRPFYVLRLSILEPREHQGRSLNGRLYCTPKALWKLRWFLRDFGYDPDLLGRDEVDEKALLALRGIVRISRTSLNGRSFLNLGGFAPASEWEELSVSGQTIRRWPVMFRYSQVSQYLRCPRSYRYRIWTDGGRMSPGRRCASAAVSRGPWRLSSSARMPEPCCLRSGEPTAKFRSSIPTEMTGSACSANGIIQGQSLP
jgi:hypothetical protein